MGENNRTIISTKKLSRKFLSLLLGASTLLSVNGLIPNSVNANESKHTTITNIENFDESSSIHVTHEGFLELPDGSQVYTPNVRYDVSMNGVYTFHTYYDNAVITRDSALIDTINNDGSYHLTNKKVAELTIASRDNLSGIRNYRIKNEVDGSWTPWRNVSSPGNSVRQTIDWTLNTSEEGIRTVFAQYRDRAGNITDSNLSSKGSTKHDLPYAEIVYTTKGPEFDVGIIDLNKTGSTYWVSPNREHVVARSSQPYVEVVFNNIRSEWSVPQNIYTSVNGDAYKKQKVTDLTADGRLIIEIPPSRRVNGPGKINIYIDDTVVNDSNIHTIDYYYDETPPTTSVSLTQDDGLPFVNETYYNQTTKQYETVKMTRTTGVNINVNARDLHSSINLNNSYPGFARILVREQTRYEYNGTWKNNKTMVYADNPDVADGHPFTNTTLRNNKNNRIQFDLTNGLETRFLIEVTDNAGNTTSRYTEPFRQSNLRLISFKILDIVNPSSNNGTGIVPEELIVTDFSNVNDVPRLSAGGNVTVEAKFDFMHAFDYDDIYGQLQIDTKMADGSFNKTTYIPLELEKMRTDQDFPRFEETFTVPEDAPMGAEVMVSGWLTLDMGPALSDTELAEINAMNPSDRAAALEGVESIKHTIYFPSENRNVSWRIGIIENHIQDHLKFRITR